VHFFGVSGDTIIKVLNTAAKLRSFYNRVFHFSFHSLFLSISLRKNNFNVNLVHFTEVGYDACHRKLSIPFDSISDQEILIFLFLAPKLTPFSQLLDFNISYADAAMSHYENHSTC
jgi:hypothetical protein